MMNCLKNYGGTKSSVFIEKLVYTGISSVILLICIFDIAPFFRFYVYALFAVYFMIFLLTLRYRSFSLYQVFLISYFVFLLSRVFLDAIGLFDVRTLDLYASDIMSDRVVSETLRVLTEFLIGTSYAWLLTADNEKTAEKHFATHAQSMWNDVFKGLFYLYTGIFLLKLFYTVRIIRYAGYASIFNGTLTDASYPIIFKGAGTITEILYLIVIFFNRDKNSFIRFSALYIFIGVFRIFTGQRSITFLMILFVLYLYSTYYTEINLFSKRVIALGISAPFVIEAIAQYRIGIPISFSSIMQNNVLFLMLKNMGVSINVVANMVRYKGKFSNRVPFLIGYFSDLTRQQTGGQTLDDILTGNYLGDHLTYWLSPDAFFAGRGTGTSIVAEVYELFSGNGFCIALGGFVVCYLVLCICLRAYKSLPWFALTYYLSVDFIYSPRWSILKRIPAVMLSIAVCLIVLMVNKRRWFYYVRYSESDG